MNSLMFDMSGVYGEEGFSPEVTPAITCTDLEGTSCYCSAESLRTIRKRISRIPQAPSLNWIDTGDYHYLSALLAERQREPFCLLLFDNHPDDQPLAFEETGMLSCGSWVKWLRENCPALSGTRWADGNGTCHGTIRENLPVYLSIDLDILGEKYFATDWNQGVLSPDDLLDLLEEEAGGRKVAGIDICGGITVAKGAKAHQLEANRRLRACLSAKISQYL